jgi:phosphohistidine phosphatase
MKSVYLLRHAKSDWSTSYSTDHERPLSKRGRLAAGTVGRFLAAVRQTPEVVVTSTAVRARTTVELAAQAGGWNCEVREEPAFYGGSSEDLLVAIRAAPEPAERLLLAGHEPTWSATVSRLSGGGDAKMVTAGVARIDLPIASWSEAEPGIGTLCWLVTPKLLQRFGG